MRKITLLSSAQRDYRDALAWYAEQSLQAAIGFETEIDDGLRRIGKTPESFPTCDDRHRFLVLRRFPFRVVYRFDVEEILIIAVAHARRKPEYWRRKKS